MSSILLQIIFGVVPKAPTITGMIDTFLFHSFLSSLARYLFYFLLLLLLLYYYKIIIVVVILNCWYCFHF